MGASANSNNLKNGFPTPGPQTPTGQNVMDHVFFMSNGEWKNAREENDYDLVIIGTGFCGYAAAKRALERNPFCNILLIERGTFFLPEHFQNLPLPFVNTLGGLSETFPWTMSAETTYRKDNTIRWQHGMVPFIGGRSTLWSAWCPRPNNDEMDGWPAETKAAARRNFKSAEALLHVQKADEVDANKSASMLKIIGANRPVYGVLQKTIQERLKKNATSIKGIYRSEAAPLASGAQDVDGIDFQKFAVPGELLELVTTQAALADAGKGARLDIVANCIVEKIHQQEGRATALQTSRGVLPLGDAKLILAMGTLPPTTLVRNSFPDAVNPGKRFSAHFISSIVARIPKKDFKTSPRFGELEIGACYIAGIGKNYRQQFHIQLSVLADEFPQKNAGTALRYMPDVVATASMAQLQSSKDYVVLVCAVLGELDDRNRESWFLENKQDENITTNSMLQIIKNKSDGETWDAMDSATFGILEEAISPKGSKSVEYWHGDPNKGKWSSKRPAKKARRVDALVHESSTLHIGKAKSAPVDLDYKLRGSTNVYVTGGALWPQGGSWNPTMTMVALAQDLADKLIPTPKK